MSENTENENVVIDNPEAVLAALERAKADAKKYREQAETLQTQLDDANTTNAGLEESIKTYQQEGKVTAVTKALATPNAERIIKFMDMDKITMEGDTLSGWEAERDRIKNDLPELFDNKRSVGGGADLFASGDKPKPKSGSEAQVARIFNRSA